MKNFIHSLGMWQWAMFSALYASRADEVKTALINNEEEATKAVWMKLIH
jgi:hypothetical protein